MKLLHFLLDCYIFWWSRSNWKFSWNIRWQKNIENLNVASLRVQVTFSIFFMEIWKIKWSNLHWISFFDWNLRKRVRFSRKKLSILKKKWKINHDRMTRDRFVGWREIIRLEMLKKIKSNSTRIFLLKSLKEREKY